MGRLLRFLLLLVVIAAIGGAAALFVFDLPPPTRVIDKDISDALPGQ